MPPSTADIRPVGTIRSGNSARVMSSPWITSCDNAPACPPPGGDHGCATLSRTAASNSSALIRAASRRATRSAIRSKLPRLRARSRKNRGGDVRNGYVMCATTSRTRQPAHSVPASHCSALSPPSISASSVRCASISARTSVCMSLLLRRLRRASQGDTPAGPPINRSDFPVRRQPGPARPPATSAAAHLLPRLTLPGWGLTALPGSFLDRERQPAAGRAGCPARAAGLAFTALRGSFFRP